MKETKDHYDRPSWRDIDNKKDKSSYSSGDKPKANKTAKAVVESAKKEYLKEINQMFSGIKGSKEFSEEFELLKKSIRKPDFVELFGTFEKKYGFPDDWDFLMLLLDRTEENFVTGAIERLLKQSITRKESTKNLFYQKLRLLEMTTTNNVILKYLKTIKKT